MLRPFPGYPACPVCGDPEVNPATLGMRWWWNEERSRVEGRFTPGEAHAGYAGRTHGGLLAALLDECLAWACAVERRTYCMTGELTLRFRAPAAIGAPVELTGWTTHSWGPYVRAEGEARAADGRVLVRARATFSVLQREEALAMRAALPLAPEHLDVLV